MSKKEIISTSPIIPDEVVINKIYYIREQKVMLDSDLAKLYGLETFRLNEQVKRNIARFPEDFMFQLTSDEWESLTSQIAISKKGRGGRRTMPYVFTEHGVLMLSSVLNSEQAIQVNIQIMRIYTKIREMLAAHQDVFLRMEQVEKQMIKHDQKIELLFDYLSKFIEKEDKPREKVGYKIGDKKE
ncbi:ORF6N domain-containing protein [Pedobacter sp. UBA4863]|uniref:ORF6N domain-containing protein n=1 Tax=Pedobacter sp. UBA4863 TaxID=1947060 RepID=UPI0025DE267E|nr:ORF6N domain-containing protein [Pedobacter sp. UBA4863]